MHQYPGICTLCAAGGWPRHTGFPLKTLGGWRSAAGNHKRQPTATADRPR